MAHKITLTGKPTSQLRKVKGNTYSFDMEEVGSPNSPKGLPNSSTISYTVFVTKKTLDKVNIDFKTFNEKCFLVQGEPTLDLPIDDCPGEIGIICFQIVELESKEKNGKKLDAADKGNEIIEENNNPVLIDFSDVDHIPIDSISVGGSMKMPNEKKLNRALAAAEINNSVEMPIAITFKHGKILVKEDGYIHLVIAKRLGFKSVPVKFVGIKNFTPNNTDEFILLREINVPDEFLSSNPINEKVEETMTLLERKGRLKKPIIIEKDTYTLKNGYIRYLCLKEKGVAYAPVKWI